MRILFALCLSVLFGCSGGGGEASQKPIDQFSIFVPSCVLRDHTCTATLIIGNENFLIPGGQNSVAVPADKYLNNDFSIQFKSIRLIDTKLIPDQYIASFGNKTLFNNVANTDNGFFFDIKGSDLKDAGSNLSISYVKKLSDVAARSVEISTPNQPSIIQHSPFSDLINYNLNSEIQYTYSINVPDNERNSRLCVISADNGAVCDLSFGVFSSANGSSLEFKSDKKLSTIALMREVIVNDVFSNVEICYAINSKCLITDPIILASQGIAKFWMPIADQFYPSKLIEKVSGLPVVLGSNLCFSDNKFSLIPPGYKIEYKRIAFPANLKLSDKLAHPILSVASVNGDVVVPSCAGLTVSPGNQMLDSSNQNVNRLNRSEDILISYLAPNANRSSLLNVSTLTHLLAYGQSLSLGVFSEPIQTTSVKNTLMFNGGTKPLENQNFSPVVHLNSCIPYLESRNGFSYESPLGGIASQVQALMNDEENISDMKFLATTSGKGGASIIELSKSSLANSPYQKLLQVVRAGMSCAQSASLNYNVPAIFYIQGEADLNMPADSYLNYLRQLIADINADVKGITGQSNDIYFISSQTRFGNASLAQIQATKLLPLFKLAAPTYPLQAVSDGLHLTGVASKELGQSLGYTFKRLVFDNVDESFAEPVISGRTGNTLTLKFNKPHFFQKLIANCNCSEGFQVYNSNISRTISGVRLISTTQIELSVDAFPGDRVRYIPALNPNIVDTLGFHVKREMAGNFLWLSRQMPYFDLAIN